MAGLRIETKADLLNAVALLAKATPRTVRRWIEDPGSVLPVTAYALEKAVEELGAAALLERVRSEAE